MQEELQLFFPTSLLCAQDGRRGREGGREVEEEEKQREREGEKPVRDRESIRCGQAA